MKKLEVFICGLFVACNIFAQSEATDTITISGRISKIEVLQKDWNATEGVSGEKIYQIYWLEFTLPTDSMTGLPDEAATHLPTNLVFASPSSGLWSELSQFKKFATNDSVMLTSRRCDVEQFVKGELRSILIKNIHKF